MQYKEFGELKNLSDVKILGYVQGLKFHVEDMFNMAKGYKFNYPSKNDREAFIVLLKDFKQYIKKTVDDGCVGYTFHSDCLKDFVTACLDINKDFNTRVNSRDYWSVTNELGRCLAILDKVK